LLLYTILYSLSSAAILNSKIRELSLFLSEQELQKILNLFEKI
jgi:hypothetical protein